MYVDMCLCVGFDGHIGSEEARREAATRLIMLALGSVMLALGVLFGSVAAFEADYTPRGGLRWRHPGGEIAAARKRAREAVGLPPLPTARDVREALTNVVFQSMKVYAERAAAGHGGRRRLLMERGDNMPVEDFELHPAARPEGPEIREEDMDVRQTSEEVEAWRVQGHIKKV